METNLLLVGILAGLLQLSGYVFYYLLVIKCEGKPNPLTWLMFAYGTALLTILELDTMIRDAKADGSWLGLASILLLPVVCSLGGVMVAVKIWVDNYRVTKMLWPVEWHLQLGTSDGKWFAVDMSLTVTYLGLWVIALFDMTTSNMHVAVVIFFLAASNATVIPNFAPILRSTWNNPQDEHWLPWGLWAAAYALLMVPTWLYTSPDVVWPTSLWFMNWAESFWHLAALMSYPVLNAVLHGAMAWVCFYRQKNLSAA